MLSPSPIAAVAAALAMAARLVVAMPVPAAMVQLLEKRLVVNPPITYPDETTVWTTGQQGVNVTW